MEENMNHWQFLVSESKEIEELGRIRHLTWTELQIKVIQ